MPFGSTVLVGFIFAPLAAGMVLFTIIRKKRSIKLAAEAAGLAFIVFAVLAFLLGWLVRF